MALHPTQVKAIELLSDGYGVLEVARLLDTHRNSIQRWLKSPEFQFALAGAQRQGLELTRARMGALADEALDTVVGIMRDLQNNPALRLRAATVVLDRCGLSEDKKQPDAPIMTEDEQRDVEEFLVWKSQRGQT